MAAVYQKRYPILTAALCLIFGVMACDKDPVAPPQRVQEGYYVYAADCLSDGLYNNIYKYDSHTQLFDSVDLPSAGYFPSSLAATPDGSELYIGTRPNTGLFILNIPVLTLKESIPSPSGSYTISRDGKYFARFGNGIQIYARKSLKLLFDRSLEGASGRFSANGNWFVGTCIRDSVRRAFGVFKINTCTGETTFPFDSLNIVRTDYLPDRGLWVLFSALASQVTGLAITDDAKKILYTHVYQPGSGDFATDTKRGVVYFTSPGNGLEGEPPQPFLFFLDLDSFVLDSLSLEHVITPGYNEKFIPKYLAISADDSILAIPEYFRSRLLLMRLNDHVIFDTTTGASELVAFGRPVITLRYKP